MTETEHFEEMALVYDRIPFLRREHEGGAWSVIPILENKRPAIRWDAYKTEPAPRNLIREHEPNFALICGKVSAPEGYSLVVPDLDIRDGKREEAKQIVRNFFAEYPEMVTLVVETPSGGLHLYYYVQTGNSTIRLRNYKNRHLKKRANQDMDYLVAVDKTHFQETFEGIDWKAEKGYVLVPPSGDERGDYEVWMDNDIANLTQDQHSEILKPHFILNDQRKVRKPFQKILRGDIQINDYAELHGEGNKQVYWRGLIAELMTVLEMDINEIIQMLDETGCQHSFNAEVMQNQVASNMDLTDPRPLRDATLRRYFPNEVIHSFDAPNEQLTEFIDYLNPFRNSDDIMEKITELNLERNFANERQIRNVLHLITEHQAKFDVLKETLGEKTPIGKRTLNNWYKEECGETTRATSHSDDEDLTYKEEIARIGDEIVDELDIITLDDSGQIMTRREGEIAYRFDKNPLIDKLIEKDRLSEGLYTRYCRESIKYVRHHTRFSRDDFVIDKHKIPFKNGVLDIQNDEFTPAAEVDGKYFYQINYNYQTVMDAPDTPERFERCFKEWFFLRSGTEGRRIYLRPEGLVLELSDLYEMIGLCLSINTEMKTHFMAYGPTDSGKTIIKDLIASIFPEDCTASKSLHAMTKDFGKMGLQFKVFVYSDETPRSTIYDTGTLKEITGGAEEKIEANIKRYAPIQFRPFMKFWWCANKLPKVHESDDATFNRFILIPFQNQFTDEPDRDLRDTLKEELPSILKNSIVAYTRLLERGKFRDELKEDTEHLWKMASDDIYRVLHEEFDQTYDPSDWVRKDEALTIFIERSDETITKAKLTKELKQYGVIIRRPDINGKREYVYAGLKRKI
jgi:P4 family phage/plasmid primase-like protien